MKITRESRYRHDANHRLDVQLSTHSVSVEHQYDVLNDDLPEGVDNTPAHIYFHKGTEPTVKVWLFDIFDETPSITLGELRELVKAHLEQKELLLDGAKQ